jgi:serine/threonine protein kinase
MRRIRVNSVANDNSTPDLSTQPVLQAGAEPIAGYRLVCVLGRGGFGEVWKCEAPGGLFKAMKVLHGDLDLLEMGGTDAEQEWEALQRVKVLRHPFLLAMDRIEIVEGRLFIVSELADCNLADELARRRAKGHRGLERGQLLAYLREAAEVLDWLNIEHGLQHLDIKPGNLFLVSNHVKVGDFGLMRSLKESTSETSEGQRVVTTTPRYAPPETLQGVISPCSDQYSLALVYHELLTGSFPFDGVNARQLALQHANQAPDLDALTEADEPVVAQALAKESRERFPTCTAFVQALLERGRGDDTPSRSTITDLGEWNTPLPQSHSSTTPPPHLLTTPHATPADGTGQGVLPGHQFLDCVGRGSLGEVWKVRTPDGRALLARIIVNPVFGAKPEQDVLAKLEEAGHPGVVPWRVATRTAQRLILLADAAGSTLHDHYKVRRTAKELGLSRDEVLACLRQVAAAVDRWSQFRRLNHLGLSPRSIFWNNDKAQVVDAGLAELLGLPAGHDLFQLNARYAAPELAEDRFSAASDVYSLAVLYYELITGQMPHRGQGPRQLLEARREGVPSLDLLPGRDRFAVQRALEPNPARRFASCTELVKALEGTTAPRRGGAREVPILPSIISTEEDVASLGTTPVLPTPHQFVADLVAAATGLLETPALPGRRARSQPDGELLYKGGARVVPDLARFILEEFCRQWHGRLEKSNNELVEFEVDAPSGWWQRLRGQKGGLRVRIELQRSTVKEAHLTEVAIRMQPIGCTAEQAEGLVSALRPALLDGLCEKLEAGTEQRQHERLIYPYPLRVIPILADRTEGEIIVCQGKDVSLGGLGLVSPHPLPTPQVYIQPTVPSERFHGAVLAKVVRVHERADGSFETGALFSVSAGSERTKR